MQKKTTAKKTPHVSVAETPPAQVAPAGGRLPDAPVKERVKALCTSLVVQGEREFLARMGELDAKGYCDIFIKLLTLAQKESGGETSAPIAGVANLINQLSINLLKS